MSYHIIIEPTALLDIQQAIDYYDAKQIGLGEKFEAALDKRLVSIQNNPFYQIRYDTVHCLPLKKYPYMIHFTINKIDNAVTVRAVFHTSQNPTIWKKDR